MTFHYDFLLKAIPSSTTWLHIMEKSYWFQERQREREALQKARDACASYLATLTLEEPYQSGCEARYQIEQERKKAVNASRKELQRQMDSLLNKQVGPKWKTAWATYHTRLEQSEMLAHHEALLEEHVPSYVEPMVSFLYRTGYLTQEDPYTLQKEHVTLKGVLATEINEGHSLLITELYTQGALSALSGEELVLLLSVFQDSPHQEDSEETHEVLREYPLLKEALHTLERITEDLQKVEEQVGSSVGEYWATTTQWMAPMARWIRGEHASAICADSNLFEGNFLRAIMKLVHTLDEVQTIAVYCQHTEYVDLITAIRPAVLRDVALSESLYVK
jgi:superfamily II RNA helicase